MGDALIAAQTRTRLPAGLQAHKLMTEQNKKLTEEERAAFALVGRYGGQATSKKHGNEYMAEIGKRGSEKRWGKKKSKKINSKK